MTTNDLYAFAYRGMLTKDAARRAANPHAGEKDGVASVTRRLPFELLEPRLVTRAKEMAAVYAAIAAFENSVRYFIEKRLLEEVGESWWEECVPEKRRERAESRREEENKIRWHAKRGESLLEYTEITDLKAIITTKQDIFLPFVNDVEWAKHILVPCPD